MKQHVWRYQVGDLLHLNANNFLFVILEQEIKVERGIYSFTSKKSIDVPHYRVMSPRGKILSFRADIVDDYSFDAKISGTDPE